MYDSIEDLNAALGGGHDGRPGRARATRSSRSPTPEVGLARAPSPSCRSPATWPRASAATTPATSTPPPRPGATGTATAPCRRPAAPATRPTACPSGSSTASQIEQEVAQGMACTTCHVAEDDFTLLEVEDVTFPSGAVLSFGTSGDNLCATCHQGRASTPTVDAAHRHHRGRRRQRPPRLHQRPLLLGRGLALRRRGHGRLPVRRQGLRRLLAARRRGRHLHPVPRPAQPAGRPGHLHRLPRRRSHHRWPCAATAVRRRLTTATAWKRARSSSSRT